MGDFSLKVRRSMTGGTGNDPAPHPVASEASPIATQVLIATWPVDCNQTLRCSEVMQLPHNPSRSAEEQMSFQVQGAFDRTKCCNTAARIAHDAYALHLALAACGPPPRLSSEP